MGEARRRKLAGEYPEQTPKVRQKARLKTMGSHYNGYLPMVLMAAAVGRHSVKMKEQGGINSDIHTD